MSWISRVRQAFRREAADVKEGVSELSERLDTDLARRERELNATPEEKLDRILDEIRASESELENLRSKASRTEDPPDQS